MAKPKPRTVADFVKELKALDRTDAEILIVASCTRWEPQKAEVAALLKQQSYHDDCLKGLHAVQRQADGSWAGRSVVQGVQTIRSITSKKLARRGGGGA